MRDVIWLETASVDVSLEIYADIAEDIAGLVKPIPIVIARESDQKVVLVHEKFFSPFHSDRFRQVPTPTTNTSSGDPSFTETIHSQSLAPRSPLPLTNTGSSTSREREPPASGDRRPTAHSTASREATSPISKARPDNSFPEDPRDQSGSVTADVDPFIGTLTVEDSGRIKQSAQILMGLGLATGTRNGTDMTTRVTIESLEMTFSAPEPQISGMDPLLDPKEIRIEVAPSGGDHTSGKQVPLHCDELVENKVTTVSEHSLNVNATAAPSPSLAVGLTKKAGESANCNSLCQRIDTSRSDIREVNNSPVWRYVLKEKAKKGLRLPLHSCAIYYPSNTPVTSMEINVDVCFETASWRKKTRLAPGYKHVKMCFSVDVKRETEQFLNLKGQQRNGSRVKLLHQFPAHGQSSRSVSYANQLATASLEINANNDRRKM
jgi:hypothetical protein